MNSSTYTDDLALELRLLDVPGVRIGEILAEVESHVAETGEDPLDAFGPVKEYARERADSQADQSGNLISRLFAGHWLMAAGSFLFTGVATLFLLTGVFALISDQVSAPFGLPPWSAIIIALVLFGAWWGWFGRLDKADRIIDPRTGRPVNWDLKGRRKAD